SGIDRYHPDERDIMEIVAFGDHLSADDQVDRSGAELHQQVLEAAAAARRIAVDAGDRLVREKLAQSGFELFGALADVLYVLAVADRADTGRRPDIVAVVALQALIVPMVGQGDVAVRAMDAIAAGPAHRKRRITAPIE